MFEKIKSRIELFRTIKTYLSISLEDIEKEWRDVADTGYSVANRLMGFGSATSCKVCVAVKSDCRICPMYYNGKKCYENDLKITYWSIRKSKSPIELYNSFRSRGIALIDLYEKKYNSFSFYLLLIYLGVML